MVRQVEVLTLPGREAFENLALIAPIVEISRRGGIDRDILREIILPNPYQPIGILIGQRSKENRIHHAEHRTVRPDPNCQGKHRHDGEPGVF